MKFLCLLTMIKNIKKDLKMNIVDYHIFTDLLVKRIEINSSNTDNLF